MRRAYHADSALAAEAELCALAAELDRTHPGAAASLREGMAETLTVLRLNIPPTLARTLRSTNAVESMISICRTHASNVKNWRDGQMALRWCAAGMVEAGKQFRRVNGHMHLRSLRDTLERITQPVGATGHTDTVTSRLMIIGPPPKFHGTRDILRRVDDSTTQQLAAEACTSVEQLVHHLMLLERQVQRGEKAAGRRAP